MAVKQLASDEDIIILPSDKGKAAVVMNRSVYSARMQAMLDDRDTYQPLSKDPTSSLESKMNPVLLKLKQEGRLSDRTYDQLCSSAGRAPRLYGLPKIQARHPTQVQCVVPVVSNIRTVNVSCIPAETGGGAVRTACEELTGLSTVHQVTAPKWNGGVS